MDIILKKTNRHFLAAIRADLQNFSKWRMVACNYVSLFKSSPERRGSVYS